MKKIIVFMSVLMCSLSLVACNPEGITEEITAETQCHEGNTDQEETQAEWCITCIECGAECESGHTYCDEHECKNKTCTAQRKSGSTLCVAHSCIYCGNARNGNMAWCRSHRCDSCNNAVVGNSHYCSEHKCPLCNRPRKVGKQYCCGDYCFSNR